MEAGARGSWSQSGNNMNTKQSQATELQGLFLETSRGPVPNPSKTAPPAGGQEFTPMH